MYINNPSAIRRNVRARRLSLSKLYNKILEPNKDTYEENIYISIVQLWDASDVQIHMYEIRD